MDGYLLPCGLEYLPISYNFSEAVTTMLILRGAPALSAFRHEKLFEQLRQKVSSVSGVYAEFTHFVEVSVKTFNFIFQQAMFGINKIQGSINLIVFKR